MNDNASTWDEIRRIADQMELEIHLAGMEVRDRWRSLQPRIIKLEHALAEKTERAQDALAGELTALGKALRELRDDVVRAFQDKAART